MAAEQTLGLPPVVQAGNADVDVRSGIPAVAGVIVDRHAARHALNFLAGKSFPDDPHQPHAGRDAQLPVHRLVTAEGEDHRVVGGGDVDRHETLGPLLVGDARGRRLAVVHLLERDDVEPGFVAAGGPGGAAPEPSQLRVELRGAIGVTDGTEPVDLFRDGRELCVEQAPQATAFRGRSGRGDDAARRQN